MAGRKVAHVIADSGAFIKNAPIQEVAENVYAIQDVISEIRDSATKKRLAVLPYEIQYREPSSEHILTVREFAKKTGDYPSLSAVDIRLMALAYQLTKEHIGIDHLKSEPDKQTTWSSSSRPLEKPTNIAGWYLPPKSNVKQTSPELQGDVDNVNTRLEDVSIDEDIHSNEKTKEGNVIEEIQSKNISKTNSNNVESEVSEGVAVEEKHKDCLSGEVLEKSTEERTQNEGGLESNYNKVDEQDTVNEQASVEHDDKEQKQSSHHQKDKGDQEQGDSEGEDGDDDEGDDDDEEEEEEEEEEEDDDDDGGWITPKNIHKVKAEINDNLQPLESVSVACMTADFAMQNVLIQMGIPVLAISGMLIKRAKSYVLKCHACFKVTKIMTKQFCPTCGNHTLRKIAVTVNEDGTEHYHISRRKQDTTRGLKYTLPLPKGGKHSNNPVLVEDQPIPQNRSSKKSYQKTNAFDPDYVANMSPFATRDVTSRAALLGVSRINSGHRKNPNENRRKKRR
ncbi:RNA-binding protein NOB1-like [Glandiceps talaboti]